MHVPSKSNPSNASQQRYLLILDFEATCRKDTRLEPQEIIELPVLVVDTLLLNSSTGNTSTEDDDTSVLDVFHEYVRPVRHPILTEFCTELTGITQNTVERADTFETVWQRLQEFITRHQLTQENSIFVTCGDWDLKTMLPMQLATTFGSSTSHIKPLFQQWVNIKEAFRVFYKQQRQQDLLWMLEILGIPLQGRHHSGIDDAKNVKRIVQRMVTDGWVPQPTFKKSSSSSTASMNGQKRNKNHTPQPQPPKPTPWTATEQLTSNLSSTFIDIGANLTHHPLCNQIPEVLDRAYRCKVSSIILTGTSIKGSQEVIDMCRAHSNGKVKLKCTVGIHPHSAGSDSKEYPDYIERLRKMMMENKDVVCAVGECGLDYDRNFSDPIDQRQVFEQQVKLAHEVGLPLFLHERCAHDDLVAILQNAYPSRPIRGVQHCFATSSLPNLQSYLSLGLHIGVTGWICDPRPNRGTEVLELIPHIPQDRLMIETDAPFLLPRNMTKPWPKVCEPACLFWVAKMVSEKWRMSVDDVGRITSKNAQEFFELGHDSEST